MFKKQLSKQKGFTLIEMVVVIAVMGILMGLAFQGFTTIQQNARDTARIADLRTVQTQLELYFARCGHYPTTAACGAITQPTTGAAFASWATLVGTSTTNLGLVTRPGEVPNDPIAVQFYRYGFGPSGLSYVVGATMERRGPNREVTGLINGLDCSVLFCLRS